MNGSLMKFVSRLLIVTVLALGFQTVQAGMIGTHEVVAAAQGQGDADKVREFLSRSEVAAQLQALGLSAAQAQERVNALTQEELQQFAGKIDSLPAGGIGDAATVILVLLIIWAIWVWKK
ncbi:MAG: PA2779 family protein [Betaproteobacteria bacterium]|nr:PA2779 family protein [Betaproteobacteria bacterium]